ncbi:hypothetical protein BSKO_01891 [Bryopsis sp. KO-2023]|nr:hypothetical protein BSKO_01891 [Bryopsis sp. KO-2023]
MMSRTILPQEAVVARRPQESAINGWRRLVCRFMMVGSWWKLDYHSRVLEKLWSFSLGSQGWTRWFSIEKVCASGHEVLTNRDFLFDMLRVLVDLPGLHSNVSSCCTSEARFLCGDSVSETTMGCKREAASLGDTWWWVSSAAGDSTTDLVGSLLCDVVSLGEGVPSLDNNKNHHPVRDALEEVPLHTLQQCLRSLFRRLILLASSFLSNDGHERAPADDQCRVVSAVRVGTAVLALLTSFPKLLPGFWEDFHVEVEHILKPIDFKASVAWGGSESILGNRMGDIIEEIIVEYFPPLR